MRKSWPEFFFFLNGITFKGKGNKVGKYLNFQSWSMVDGEKNGKMVKINRGSACFREELLENKVVGVSSCSK